MDWIDFEEITIPDNDEDERAWYRFAKEKFLAAYDEKDAIYDEV